MTRPSEIAGLLKPYVMLYPHCKLDDAGRMLYGKVLCEYSLLEIDTAMIKLLRECKFFPTVAEIVEQIKKMRDIVQDNETFTSAEAWEEAMQNVKKHGVYGKWEYSRPEVEQAVKQFGGRNDLCMLEIDAVNTARAQFMRIYDSIVSKSEDRRKTKEAITMLGQSRAQQLIDSLANRKALLEG